MTNRPRLLQQDVVYYSAFNTLHQSRPSGGMGGPVSIPVSELLAFCLLVGIANFQERSKYLGLIQAMDQIWLEHCAEEQKKHAK